VGVLVAGILFGAFKAGGFAMQAAEGVPIDIVLVVQSLIVLFIAAPPLVRAIFRLPEPGARPRGARRSKVRASRTKEVAAK
jgi:general nucleoside transport system permease protein